MITFYKILLILFGIFLAGCFAGSETGIYCLSRFRLRLAIKHKYSFAALLGKLVSDTQGLILSLLIGTNLAHYLTTSIVTYMFLSISRTSHTAEIYTTVIMTPILFVFSELIPKNIFMHHADALLPRLSPGIWIFHKICTLTGIVPLLKFLSRSLNRLMKSPLDAQPFAIGLARGRLSQIIHETTEEGILSSAQRDIINQFVNLPNIPVSTVMTPVNKVEMAELKSSRQTVLDFFSRTHFTRLPVYENDKSNIIGFINIYEVLAPESDFDTLQEFVKPIVSISQDTSVAEALYFMRNEKHRIALVTQYPESKKIVGILTIKDLIEELVGGVTK